MFGATWLLEGGEGAMEGYIVWGRTAMYLSLDKFGLDSWFFVPLLFLFAGTWRVQDQRKLTLFNLCHWANLSVVMEAFYLFRLTPSHYRVFISWTGCPLARLGAKTETGQLVVLGLGSCMLIMWTRGGIGMEGCRHWYTTSLIYAYIIIRRRKL